MQHTLLSLRLMLQHGRSERGRTRVGEPVLAVDTRRVAAAWSCGCLAIGPTFEGLSWIACDAHERALDAFALPSIGSKAPIG